ncbi:MAG TPA: hypothetical protein VFG47_14340 [Geminicoccaceae bacterium]|nr:hypothetical protein [Geminicoccaceae bacterium]
MTVKLAVSCGKDLRKDFKDGKDVRKEKPEIKERQKDKVEIKERPDKNPRFEKPVIDKQVEKPIGDKRPEKPITDKRAGFDKDPRTEKIGEKIGEGGFGRAAPDVGYVIEELEARVAALEQSVAGLEPFIGGELRPDLRQGALSEEGDLDDIQRQMLEGDAQAKRLMDSRLPPR